MDPNGNIYFTEPFSRVIRKVNSADCIISTFAGTGNYAYSGDGGQATQADIARPMELAIDQDNNLFFADGDNLSNVIRSIDTTTGIISRVAGTPGVYGHEGDDGPATSATFAMRN